MSDRTESNSPNPDRPASDVAFTPTVKAIQERLGSRAGYAAMEARGGFQREITPELEHFVAERDTLFLGTVSSDGQPYIQHRGGPPGFLKVLDERTLALADFAGNRQYVSMGNLADNPRAFLFLIDFANRRRIKVWGTAEMREDDPELLARMVDPAYPARPERALVFRVEAWDVNCPQHITPRFTAEEVAETVAGLRARVAELEGELAARPSVAGE